MLREGRAKCKNGSERGQAGRQELWDMMFVLYLPFDNVFFRTYVIFGYCYWFFNCSEESWIWSQIIIVLCFRHFLAF